jgi:protein-tyrosine phosphatase
VWDCNATDVDLSNGELRILTVRWEDNGEEEAATLAPTVIADATTENIQQAKEFINGLTASGGNVAVCCAGIAL